MITYYSDKCNWNNLSIKAEELLSNVGATSTPVFTAQTFPINCCKKGPFI